MQSVFAPNRRRDILLLTFSVLGILGLLGRGVYLFVSDMVSSSLASSEGLSSATLELVSMLWCALMLVPIFVYSLRRLRGREILPANIPGIKFWHIAVLGSVWMVSLLVASLLDSLFDYGWVVAAPFFLLGISLPILIVLWVAAGGIATGSRRRLWSVFGMGMAGSTVVAMALELLIAWAGLLVAELVASFDPEWNTAILQLKDQFTSTTDIQVLLSDSGSLLTHPLVFLVALVFIAGLAPMIEEALKPAALWFLGKRLRSPAEGFVLGALCGAGFALLEGISVAGGMTETVGFGLAARAASSLMHITASGLLGWAIASAQLEKRYFRLVITYILAVALHGLWNGSALLAVYGGLRISLQSVAEIDFPGALFILAGVGLLGVVLISALVFLPLANHFMRSAPAAQNDIIAPPPRNAEEN